jgi:hypothetical protein
MSLNNLSWVEVSLVGQMPPLVRVEGDRAEGCRPCDDRAMGENPVCLSDTTSGAIPDADLRGGRLARHVSDPPRSMSRGSRYRREPVLHGNPTMLGHFRWRRVGGVLQPYIPLARTQRRLIEGSRDYLVGVEKNPGPTDNKGKRKETINKSPVKPDPKGKAVRKPSAKVGKRQAKKDKAISKSCSISDAKEKGKQDAVKEVSDLDLEEQALIKWAQAKYPALFKDGVNELMKAEMARKEKDCGNMIDTQVPAPPVASAAPKIPTVREVLEELKSQDNLEDYVRGKTRPDPSLGDYEFPLQGAHQLARFDDQLEGGHPIMGKIIIADMPSASLPLWAPYKVVFIKIFLYMLSIFMFHFLILGITDLFDWLFPIDNVYTRDLLTATRGMSESYFKMLTDNRSPLRVIPGLGFWRYVVHTILHFLYHLLYTAVPNHWLTNLVFAPIDLIVFVSSLYSSLFMVFNIPWRVIRFCLWVYGHENLFYEETGFYLLVCPISLGRWFFSTAEKIKSVRLVLIPRRRRTCVKDFRPEGDRTEKLNGSEFWYMHVAVEVRTKDGKCDAFRYYKDWETGVLPDQWYKKNKRTLKTVLISPGLVSTALNRKTMMADNTKPEVAIDTMVRMLQANPHYQAELHVLASEGHNMYRDMCLVFGALIAKDVVHGNKYF